MLITTKFDIGDDVKVGPHSGKIGRIFIGQSITYEILYWNDGSAHEYSAFDFEIELIESVAPQE